VRRVPFRLKWNLRTVYALISIVLNMKYFCWRFPIEILLRSTCISTKLWKIVFSPFERIKNYYWFTLGKSRQWTRPIDLDQWIKILCYGRNHASFLVILPHDYITGGGYKDCPRIKVPPVTVSRHNRASDKIFPTKIFHLRYQYDYPRKMLPVVR